MSPNSTVEKVKRFVSKVPPNSQLLRLLAAADGAPMVLREWEADGQDLDADAVAEAVCEAIADFVSELGQQASVTLTWLGADGRVLASLPMKPRPRPVANSDDGLSIVQQLDGSGVSLVVQSQRHLEAMARNYSQSTGGLLHSMQKSLDIAMRLTSDMGEQLMESKREARRWQSMYERLRAEVGEPDAEAAEVNSAQERAMGMLEKVLPAIIMAHVGAPQGSNAPPSTPPA